MFFLTTVVSANVSYISENLSELHARLFSTIYFHEFQLASKQPEAVRMHDAFLCMTWLSFMLVVACKGKRLVCRSQWALLYSVPHVFAAGRGVCGCRHTADFSWPNRKLLPGPFGSFPTAERAKACNSHQFRSVQTSFLGKKFS